MPEHQPHVAPVQGAQPTSARSANEQRPVGHSRLAGLRPSQASTIGSADPGHGQNVRAVRGRRTVRPSRLPAARPSLAVVRSRLAVSPAADRYEYEANQVADAVVRQLPAWHAERDAVANGRAPGATGEGMPMQGTVREAMEDRFGVDFSAVQVHNDSMAHQLSEAINATAFTSGSGIFLGKSAPNLSAPAGQRLVAHELTHVLQQGAVAAPHHAPVHRTSSPLVQRVVIAPSDPAGAKKDHDKAVEIHKSQSQTVKNWVEDGLKSKDTLLVNSCEWIIRGMSKLYAVTRTGDSYMRVINAGGKPDEKVAYFPKAEVATEPGDINAPSATYAYGDLGDNGNIRIESSSTRGWTGEDPGPPTTIAITHSPSATALWGMFNDVKDPVSKEQFFENLKHEVQHHADRHHGPLAQIKDQSRKITQQNDALSRLDEALRAKKSYDQNDLDLLPPDVADAYKRMGAVVGGASTDTADRKLVDDFQNDKLADPMKVLSFLGSLTLYKTEYRAYSYSGTYGKIDNVRNYSSSETQNFQVGNQPWTERQFKIFKHIYNRYPGVKFGWDKNYKYNGKTFREAVIEYLDPRVEGANELNSIRVHNVYNKLMLIPPGTSPVDQQKLSDLQVAVNELTPREAEYLLDKGGNVWREFTHELSRRVTDAAQLKAINYLLEQKAKS